ncbi:MAG: hypothetical protein KDB14_14910 [Planctomycetales bacterium]|nr:hypothetical protein [Planctomycetales bacterium]
MNAPNYRLGWFALLTIMALRVGVGMHFYGEGAKKLDKQKPFTSQYFLAAAKGPLAEHYHKMIWDKDGVHRLSIARDDGKLVIDITPTKDAWELFRSQIVDHYGVSGEEQLTEAVDIVKRREDELQWYLDSNYDDIIEYARGLERVEDNSADPVKQAVPSLYGQAQKIEGELYGKRGAWLATIDGIWADVENDLNQFGQASNSAATPLSLTRLGRRPLDSVAIDKIIPWFDLSVGVLLIVGLFTRVAALAAGLFLFSVCLSQWPLHPGADSIWPQAIEMLACFALVGLAAGRIAGLDSILHNIRMWCCPPRETEE